MGQQGSKDRNIFVQMLKAILRARGCSVRTHQIQQVLDFIQGTCPRFPNEGTVNLETWEKVGMCLWERFLAEEPKDFPIPTFALWGLVRHTLDPAPSASRLPAIIQQLKSTVEGYEALKKTAFSPSFN